MAQENLKAVKKLILCKRLLKIRLELRWIRRNLKVKRRKSLIKVRGHPGWGVETRQSSLKQNFSHDQRRYNSIQVSADCRTIFLRENIFNTRVNISKYRNMVRHSLEKSLQNLFTTICLKILIQTHIGDFRILKIKKSKIPLVTAQLQYFLTFFNLSH